MTCRSLLPLLALLAGCNDLTPPSPATPQPPAGPRVLGIYEIEMRGIGTNEMSSSVRAVQLPRGGRATLSNVPSGITIENVGASSFTDGTRTTGGQRYGSFTFRIRNGTGAPLTNLTLIPVVRPFNLGNTALSAIRLFNGTDANPAIAPYVVPTGAVALEKDLTTLKSLYPDVLQAFTESEVAAIAPIGDITSILPYGYSVRRMGVDSLRTLPATSDPQQFDGRLTMSFRLPLQASASLDVFSLVFQVILVEDTETRLTESIEEAQDSAAVRRLRELAVAMHATTVTVLAGSDAPRSDVPDYPGQRQICLLRTAGTAAAPEVTITSPGGYARLEILRPNESASPCEPGFRSGTPTAPVLESAYSLKVRAMDRYGNFLTGIVDSITLTQVSGPSASYGPRTALTSGQATIPVTWHANGVSQLQAVGMRLRGERRIEVATAATIEEWAGDNVAAMVSTATPIRPMVRVRDLGGAPLQGVPVQFAIGAGNGSLTGASTVTDANGIARAGSWVLGYPADYNTVIATAAGAPGQVVFHAAGCEGGGGIYYNISLCFTTPMSSAQRNAFRSAVQRWEAVVVDDLPDLSIAANAGACGSFSPLFDLSIDDLLIFAAVQPIDGAGGVLGQGTPCYDRAGGLPLLGYMRFDTADLTAMESDGTLTPVILHEMGHVLGIGTRWGALVHNPSPVGGPAADTYFAGLNAIAGFNAIGGTYYFGGQKVPVENTGPARTINVHWRESMLLTELMTGYIDSAVNPLSDLTIGSLQDLGYGVNHSAADPFYITYSLRAGASEPTGRLLVNDVPDLPVRTVPVRAGKIHL